MSSTTYDLKDAMSTVEDIEMSQASGHHHARGTVKLLDENTVILIPTPSPDPKGSAVTVEKLFEMLLIRWKTRLTSRNGISLLLYSL